MVFHRKANGKVKITKYCTYLEAMLSSNFKSGLLANSNQLVDEVA